MKNTLILISILTFIGLSANAQVEKGDVVLGANFNASTAFINESASTSLMLNLSAERYFTDNISIGIAPLVLGTFSEDADTGVGGLSIFGQYSFLTSGGTALPYVGSQYTFIGLIGQDFSIGSLGVNGGLKLFVTEKVSIDTKLSYTTYIHSSEDEVPDGGILQLNIGFSVIL